MATKHKREASGNSSGLAEAAIALVARSRELGQGHVATLEEIAELNAPARPTTCPATPTSAASSEAHAREGWMNTPEMLATNPLAFSERLRALRTRAYGNVP